ncbi:hypothetical protein NFI00_000087 [Salmonella enterica]|nr:hypothetical protein [Salmonella enterica subsp. enterica serovar Minnesota]EJI5696384.1 hypothetical protein [Salmonella enterica]
MTDKAELIDFAELEERRDVALTTAEAMCEEMNRIYAMTEHPLTGQTVLAIVAKLAPNSLLKAQERVVSMECVENAYVLKDINFSGPGSYCESVVDNINKVMAGYAAHCVDVFAKVLASIPSDSSKAGQVYADIGRCEQLAMMWQSDSPVQINEWEDIVPFNHESGDYLMNTQPLESFKEHVEAFASFGSIWNGNLWNLAPALEKAKERIRIFQLLHKRVHSYL